jgi:hypothetical protein
MKKNLFYFIAGLTTAFHASAQKGDALTTQTFDVRGNCEMCKKTIEAAANKKGVKTANWNAETKVLEVTYNNSKTSSSEILRAVAYAGYDNSTYLAPENAYKSLAGCCQYKREQSQPLAQSNSHANHKPTPQSEPVQQKENGVQAVYDNYFKLKDALVASNAKTAADAALQLVTSMDAVNMSSLKNIEHEVYMQQADKIKSTAKKIDEAKNIEKQRSAFGSMTDPMYEMMKAIKPAYEVYRDHCPMYNDGKGSDWLSKEKAIKNPYYGSKMLTCGNVTETLN